MISSQDSLDEPPQKRASHQASSLQKYKDKLTYDPSWKKKHPWMDCIHDSTTNENGMICTVCKAFCNPPVQARGAWVTRPINNWVKATALLSKHERSEWHLAAVEKGTSPFFS